MHVSVTMRFLIKDVCEPGDFGPDEAHETLADLVGDLVESEGILGLAEDAGNVNGQMPAAERDGLLRELAAAPGAVMSNARCLTEGVDVPAVDLVAFMAPKSSQIDIVQAAGRAMRLSPGKSHGYILLPVYLDEADQDRPDAAIDRAHFGPVREVLHAIAEHDDAFADIIRELREAKGACRGYDDTLFRERVEVLGPELTLDLLRRVITVKTIEELGEAWDEMFGRLRAYKATHGHCNAPRGSSLGIWVKHQRSGKEQLSPERVQRLDALGFEWDRYEAAWEAQCSALAEFKRTHGHCNVPDDGSSLGDWVNNQRSRQDRLSPERRHRLAAMGFEWSRHRHEAWEAQCSALAEFKRTHGHCNVPNGSSLGRWVRWVRGTRAQRSGKDQLSPERVQRLDALSFVWDVLAANWEIRCSELVEYQKRFGHCNVPQGWVENRVLAVWVAVQRRRKLLQTIPKDQVTRLDALGFVWRRLDVGPRKKAARPKRRK